MHQINESFRGWRLTCWFGSLNDVHTNPATSKETSRISTLAEEGYVHINPCGLTSQGYCDTVRGNEPFSAAEWADALLPPWDRSLRT